MHPSTATLLKPFGCRAAACTTVEGEVPSQSRGDLHKPLLWGAARPRDTVRVHGIALEQGLGF